jgi:O-antigen ligase
MIIVSLLAYTWKAKLRGLTLAVLVAGAIVGVASVAIPVILTQLPSWEMHFDRLVHWRTDDAMSGRRDLLEKGWLIVRENPVLGVGVGMSKPYVPAGASLRRKGGLIHNGYLTAWAELGMAGLVTALVLIGLWLAEMRARILEPCWRTVDFLCLVVAGTILAMNFFLDYPPIFWLCATLICGLHYQRRCRGESLKAAPSRRAAGRSPKGMVAARFAGYPWLRASQHRAAALR